jgi:hypothetical protein
MGSMIAKALVSELMAYFEAHPETIANLIAALLPHLIAHFGEKK